MFVQHPLATSQTTPPITKSLVDDQRPMSPGRWARSLRGKRYRISPYSPLKQEVSENYRYRHLKETSFVTIVNTYQHTP